MQSPFTDASYLAYQYDDSEKLRIRIETHRRYTEGDDDFTSVELQHIAPRAGLRALDVGCGPARLASDLHARGVDYIGLDRSGGLLRESNITSPGAFLQADATMLPFADASFDRVICLGVLYHVPNWEQALREMRRVVRPGGRVVLATNGADAMRRIYDVHREAAIELGYRPLPFGGGRAFRLENLPEVQAIFPSAQCYVRDNALVFPDAEPALRFYATNRIDMIEGWDTSTEHRARLLPLVRAKIDAIIAREGCFRVAKSFGYIVADV